MDFIKQRPWVVPLAAMLVGFLPILLSFFRQQLAQPEQPTGRPATGSNSADRQQQRPTQDPDQQPSANGPRSD